MEASLPQRRRLTTKYITLMKQARETTSRKEAKKLINQATEVREKFGNEFRYDYSGLN